MCGGIGIAPGECDCDGNVLDECGVCGGEGLPPARATAMATCLTNVAFVAAMKVTARAASKKGLQLRPRSTVFDGHEYLTCAGCTDPDACNYDDTATIEDGSSFLGRMRRVWGEGAVFGVVARTSPRVTATATATCSTRWRVCTGIPDDECDCDGKVLDALGECGGTCEADNNETGCATTSRCRAVWTSTTLCTTRMRTWTMGHVWLAVALRTGLQLQPRSTVPRTGACEFESCAGCSDSMACNFNPDAQIADDTSGTYPDEAFVDWDGVCLNDTDGDGVCDELEVEGCTDSTNPGYDANATEHDDDACYSGGCLLEFACNYDPENEFDFFDLTTCDFNSCVGCMDATACNSTPAPL